MPTIDLNAKRAARREARGERLVVELGEERIDLPAELPLSVLDELGELAKIDDTDALEDNAEALETLQRATRSLFGEDGWTRFVSAGASLDDLLDVVTAVLDSYGVSLGEASGSGDSSPSNGQSSSPTSPASTESTSETGIDSTPTGAPV